MAQAQQDAVQERVERRARWQSDLADGGPKSPPSQVVEPADHARELERERSRAQHLQGQIAALREMAAQHSPGADSGVLALLQMRQLAELLEQHRDQLRLLLNGSAVDEQQPALDP
ncbi:hypothetical protein [Mycobacteroides franklinii]|uniref:Uncharacterized protein n=2 Tax=Mycobacteroides franklinii TaxID=948102 RepID=A0A1S1LCY1_9MYCO|nr:hypothetical protein [Mycobacteroides franklinii]NGX06869.1 hypothetical protein [Mycobacteroides franklinii]OHU30841.1 hypothetical protein BKG76_03745 [Mycobacteroides franklinii]ORA61647.1 hypothetical protein BST24_09285 [Mycobacteroides franklinii]TDH19189.1 hypothetical protein EJ571_21750 [Mycobacteroides franklinii]TDZ41908.1 hypothetical protein CCUG64054_01942 [Mycobacteroides franklinii]